VSGAVEGPDSSITHCCYTWAVAAAPSCWEQGGQRGGVRAEGAASWTSLHSCPDPAAMMQGLVRVVSQREAGMSNALHSCVWTLQPSYLCSFVDAFLAGHVAGTFARQGSALWHAV
jgi:hypothetical protein